MRKILPLFIAFAFVGQLTYGQAVKKVLIEEFTGAWCGFCPDGALIMDDILATYPGQSVGLALHNGDGMVSAVGNQCINFFTTGFPSGVVDRMQAQNNALSRNVWESEAVSRMSVSAPVSVSLEDASFDGGTNMLTVTLRAAFVSNVTGNLRTSLIISEDSVTGSGSGFNQTNYYNTTSGHPYYGAGDPIIGYVHRHVVRAAGAASYWGNNGVLPSSVSAGEEYTATYNIYINPSWDINHLHIVGLVNRFDGTSAGQREVLNAEEVAFSILTGQEEQLTRGATIFDAYPNPFTDQVTFSFELKNTENVSMDIYNTLGQQVENVASGSMGAGMHTLTWHANGAENGVYIAKLTTENGESVTKRIVLAR